MKKYLAGLLLLAPGLALAQTPAPTTYSYRIKGKLGQFNAPAKVYLLGGITPSDSATLRQGQFELKGTMPFPHSATLVLERQGRLRSGWQDRMYGSKTVRVYIESPDNIRLFLEPGPVVVTSPDSLPKAHLAGGKLTTDYQQLTATINSLVAKNKTNNAWAVLLCYGFLFWFCSFILLCA